MNGELQADYSDPNVIKILGWDVNDRTCPNCGDVVPVGWTLDDHFNCNWPEDFE